MARRNALRSIEGESNLAKRVQTERERRGWSYETLARHMSDKGCAINGSAIFRIEKGSPPRKISVDELITFAQVFDSTVEDLLTPVELLRKERVRELVATIEEGQRNQEAGLAAMASGYVEYFEIAAFDPDLREYASHRLGWSQEAAEDFVPERLFEISDDDAEIEVDEARLRAAIIEVHLALIEFAADAAEQMVEKRSK